MKEQLSQAEVHESVRLSNYIEGIFAGPRDNLHFGQHVAVAQKLICSEKLISVAEIHAQLMQHLLEDGAIPGQYRTQRVTYVSGNKLLPKSTVVPKLMLQFESTLQMFLAAGASEDLTSSGIIQVLNTFHDIGLCIHPFTDGNGRTFRLALNHWRRLCDLPWIQFTPAVWQEHLGRLKLYEKEVFRPTHAWAYEPDT